MVRFNEKKEFYYRGEHTVNFPAMMQTKETYPLNRKILHPEDKLARKPIIQWLEEINLSLSNLSSQGKIMAYLNDAAVIFNQATYIMSAVDDCDHAYKFCHHAIVLFNGMYKRSKQHEHLFYSIQPWINLIRLDRMSAKEHRAMARLALLLQPSQNTASVYEDIIANALRLPLSKDILEVINNAYFFEKIKILLQQQNYFEISALKSHPRANHYHQSLIAESEIIACNHLNEFDKAFSIAAYEYKNGLPIAMPVFLYRILELVSKEQAKEFKLIDTLMDYIRRKLKTGNYSLYDLIFMFEVYQFIFSQFDEYKDIELLLLFSAAFLKENDEPGRIDSLRLAAKLDNKYSEELKQLIKNSNYCFVNKEVESIIKKSFEYDLMLKSLESLCSNN